MIQKLENIHCIRIVDRVKTDEDLNDNCRFCRMEDKINELIEAVNNIQSQLDDKDV